MADDTRPRLVRGSKNTRRISVKAVDFPPEVHASLAALRAVAKAAKSRHDPLLRYATPDEMALAESQRQRNDCTAHSGRTGLPCRIKAVTGGTVCVRHGALLTHVKNAREKRLQDMVGPVLGEMYKMARSPTHSMVKQRAAMDLLDRAGVGALVEAQTRASYRGAMTGGVTVQIGFLQTPLQVEGTHDAGQPLLTIPSEPVHAATAEAQRDSGPGPGDPQAGDRGGHSA